MGWPIRAPQPDRLQIKALQYMHWPMSWMGQPRGWPIQLMGQCMYCMGMLLLQLMGRPINSMHASVGCMH